MSDLKHEAEHWQNKVNALIESIYQVKDNALGNPFDEGARWHERLSRVAGDLRLLHAWLTRVAAQWNSDERDRRS